ncbi:DUF736 family protein [Mesorhizobium sp. M0923]
MIGGSVLAAAPAWISHPPLAIWNASASVPIGLYRILPADKILAGSIAVVMPPEPLVAFMARRGYLPKNVPLLKHVLALGGATVCREGTAIIVNGRTYGHARERDSRGRSLPSWRGCREIADDDVFLMNPNAAESFDGRYFGPLPLASIVGCAVPVWTTERAAPVLDVTNDVSRRYRHGSSQRSLNAHERSTAMPQIGTFTRNDDGFFGNLSTLTIEAKIAILPAEKSKTENAPDHLVYCEGMAVGAAWDHTGDKAGDYVSVSIDDPSFTQPIRAKLFQSDAENSIWSLHWNRSSKRDGRG